MARAIPLNFRSRRWAPPLDPGVFPNRSAHSTPAAKGRCSALSTFRACVLAGSANRLTCWAPELRLSGTPGPSHGSSRRSPSGSQNGSTRRRRSSSHHVEHATLHAHRTNRCTTPKHYRKGRGSLVDLWSDRWDANDLSVDELRSLRCDFAPPLASE